MQRGFPAVVITCLMFLSACFPDKPNGLAMSYSTYVQSPVVIEEFKVNGQHTLQGKTEVQGLADLRRPHDNSGWYMLPRDIDANGTLQIEAVWVELLTHKAFRAEIVVPVLELQRSASNFAEMKPVFGPGGLMLITSDPLPETPDSRVMHDVGRVCGERMPELDQDYTNRLFVKDIIEYNRPAGVGKGCE